jgi:glutaconyl-CoA/methylmalonyl-CoA decarboxylase subunit gamma
MRYFVTFPSGEEVAVDLDHLPTGELSVAVGGKQLDVDAVANAGAAAMRIDGHVVDLVMEGAPPGVGVIAHGHRFYAKVESERAKALSLALGGRGGSVGEGMVLSPMPGRVLKVLVAEGDAIAAGQPLVVVEAMKMENELSSQRDGTVKKVFVTPGQTVESGAKLIEVA